MVHTIGDFLFDTWIWNLTWGWNQVILSLVIMWMLAVFVGRYKSVPALLMTVSSYFFSFILFSAFVIFVVIYLFKWKYVSQTSGYVPINVWAATFSLAAIYSFFQSIFYLLICRWTHMKESWLFIITIIANCIGAIFASIFSGIPT